MGGFELALAALRIWLLPCWDCRLSPSGDGLGCPPVLSPWFSSSPCAQLWSPAAVEGPPSAFWLPLPSPQRGLPRAREGPRSSSHGKEGGLRLTHHSSQNWAGAGEERAPFTGSYHCPGGSDGKASACSAGDPGSPWVGKISWRRKWQPTPVFLPGESHGRRSLIGYSPWGRRV